MNPIGAGIIVFICTFGGALLGMRLSIALPEHHLDAESRETVKLGFGLVAMMTALVLGLVTASAKSSFDAMDSAVKQTAVEILSLDRILARYGPETKEIRKNLKHGIGVRIDMVWPQGSLKHADLDPMRTGAGLETEELPAAIRSLKPRDDSQDALRSRALDLAEKLLQTRWLLLAGTEISVPMPFLVTLLFWLTITFMSFGLFAPRHATVIAVLFFCALSVGSAVFLILEMSGPFEGVLRISADPFRYVYAHLNM